MSLQMNTALRLAATTLFVVASATPLQAQEVAGEEPVTEQTEPATPDSADTAPAALQIESADPVEEILITTARKRRESIFETPAALTILDGEQLQSLNVGQLEQVAKYVPNLNITRFGVGNTSQAAVFIRGIGLQDHLITTDPGVGVYLDGVYLGRQMGNNLSLANIERIEVLRGPQGTLYGRNTLGGAINIITHQPGDEETQRVQLQTGTHNRLATNFYSNFRLSDTFALSATGGFTRRDGVGQAINLVNPEAEIGEISQFSGRVAAKWDVTDRLRLIAAVDGMSAENGQSPSTIEIIGAPVGGFGLPQLEPSDIPARDDTATLVAGLESTSNHALGASLTIQADPMANWQVQLLSSYRTSSYTGGLDDDITALHLSEFPERGKAEQYSAELQVSGAMDALDIVSGLYYFYERGANFSGPFTFAPFNNGTAGDFFRLRQNTQSYAGYANAGYHVTRELRVGGGLRYSNDHKRATAIFPTFAGTREVREKTFDAVTWDANAGYELANNVSVYAQVQRGYQTGGFPPRPFGGPAEFNIFDKITAINYEVGFKGIIDQHITVFTSAFWTEYKDLALPFSQPQATGFVTIVENAGSSRAVGVELEANFKVEGFFFNPSVGFIEAEITDVIAGTKGIQKGASPALTPRWTRAASAGYAADLAAQGSVRAQVDYSFRDEQFGQSVESTSELMAARSLVGFNIQYQNQGRDWQLELYGENLLDEVYDQGRLNNTFHGFVGIVLSNDRREVGVRFTKWFGAH